MKRSIVLAILSAFSFGMCEALAQTNDGQPTGLIKTRSASPAKPIFTTPPSYLETLKPQTGKSSLDSKPRLDTVEQPKTPAPTVAKPARPDWRQRGVWAPTPPMVHTYQAIAPQTAGQEVKAPVLQGFTVKNGKVKLRSLSANAPGGVNNKFLELQERELIEKSGFAPPGSPPHTNMY
jgi:hypothetical protein